MRARRIRPHGSVGDLAGEPNHGPAQRGENDRWQLARTFRARAQLFDEAAHVLGRLAGLHLVVRVDRRVAHSDAEPEAASGQLVDQARGLGIILRVARVDVDDRRAERDRLRHQGQGLAEAERVTEARTVETGEAAALDLLREIQRGASAAGDGGE